MKQRLQTLSNPLSRSVAAHDREESHLTQRQPHRRNMPFFTQNNLIKCGFLERETQRTYIPQSKPTRTRLKNRSLALNSRRFESDNVQYQRNPFWFKEKNQSLLPHHIEPILKSKLQTSDVQHNPEYTYTQWKQPFLCYRGSYHVELVASVLGREISNNVSSSARVGGI